VSSPGAARYQNFVTFAINTLKGWLFFGFIVQLGLSFLAVNMILEFRQSWENFSPLVHLILQHHQTYRNKQKIIPKNEVGTLGSLFQVRKMG